MLHVDIFPTQQQQVVACEACDDPLLLPDVITLQLVAHDCVAALHVDPNRYSSVTITSIIRIRVTCIRYIIERTV